MDSAGIINASGMNLLLQPSVNLTFDYYIFDNPAVTFSLFAIYTLVFCLCLFGNLAVVLIVTVHWRMRSVTKFCMGNLAFANLCVAIFCIYQNLFTFLREDWIFGSFLCKMYHFTNSLSHSASILILVVIFGERYLSIVHPLWCKRVLTIRRLRIIIVGVWVLSALISSPRLYYVTTFPVTFPLDPDGHIETICAPKRTLYNSRTADMMYFIVLFLLPLLFMCVLYGKMRIVFSQSSALLQRASPVLKTFPTRPSLLFQVPAADCCMVEANDKNFLKLQSRQAAVRMLIAIVVTFAICNLPYHLRKIFQYYVANYNLSSSFNQFFTPITFVLMYTNCAVIPILYAAMSKHFRSSLKDLFQLRLTRYMVVQGDSAFHM